MQVIFDITFFAASFAERGQIRVFEVVGVGRIVVKKVDIQPFHDVNFYGELFWSLYGWVDPSCKCSS